MEQTLKQAAEYHTRMQYPMGVEQEYPINDFYSGAKWQKEQMLKDMQEYAEFCIMCDRKQMPLLLVEDWYKHYK